MHRFTSLGAPQKETMGWLVHTSLIDVIVYSHELLLSNETMSCREPAFVFLCGNDCCNYRSGEKTAVNSKMAAGPETVIGRHGPAHSPGNPPTGGHDRHASRLAQSKRQQRDMDARMMIRRGLSDDMSHTDLLVILDCISASLENRFSTTSRRDNALHCNEVDRLQCSDAMSEQSANFSLLSLLLPSVYLLADLLVPCSFSRTTDEHDTLAH